MTVKGHLEGGGKFELDDGYVDWLRNNEAFGFRADASLKAALPPEPYVPQVGERVQWQAAEMKGKWSLSSWEYRGEFEGCHMLRCAEGDTPTSWPKAHYRLRKAGGA